MKLWGYRMARHLQKATESCNIRFLTNNRNHRASSSTLPSKHEYTGDNNSETRQNASFGFGIVGITFGGLLIHRHTNKTKRDNHQQHIVIIGGGIMGSWATYLLAKLIANDHIR